MVKVYKKKIEKIKLGTWECKGVGRRVRECGATTGEVRPAAGRRGESHLGPVSSRGTALSSPHDDLK